LGYSTNLVIRKQKVALQQMLQLEKSQFQKRPLHAAQEKAPYSYYSSLLTARPIDASSIFTTLFTDKLL
jgi:hypothetical protein